VLRAGFREPVLERHWAYAVQELTSLLLFRGRFVFAFGRDLEAWQVRSAQFDRSHKSARLRLRDRRRSRHFCGLGARDGNGYVRAAAAATTSAASEREREHRRRREHPPHGARRLLSSEGWARRPHVLTDSQA